MNRNQHNARENSLNPGLSSAEIERKWRLLKEEQDRMELMEAIANVNKYAVASATTGAGPLYPPEMFVTTWDTTLISTGSSTGNQIRLPLIETGSYSFFVDWGDETSSIITSHSQAEITHTYASPKIYTVKIVGTCHGWCFNNSGDRLKLLNVKQWGTSFRPFNNYGTFYGCRNLTLNDVIGVIDLTGMTSLQAFFFECLSLTQVNNINGWNTSGITSMRQVFESAREFDDNISGWDTSNVTDMQNMFANDFMFNNGGNPNINNWDTSKVTTFRFMFGSDSGVPSRFSRFNQPIVDWNTSSCTTMSSMFFKNPAFNQDIGTKVVTKNGVTYIAWDTFNVTDMSFMFGSFAPGGTLVPVGSFNNGSSDSIKNWNTSKVTLMTSMFSTQNSFDRDIGTKIVTINGNTYTAWDVSNVTNMSFMLNSFLNIGNATGIFNNGGSDSIKNWNTSKVTTLQAFCQRQALFNQDVGTKVVTVGENTYTAWNVENVTNMSVTFSVTSPITSGTFNNGGSDSIKNWNTSKVTTLNSTFAGQVQFNQDISTKRVTVGASTYTAWDTLNVTIMTSPIGVQTGYFGIFNQNIGNWNTSKVTTMSTFAFNQPNFNQDISTKVVTVGPSTYTAWNTSEVTNMTFMFGISSGRQGQFNQNIGNWNTSKLTTIATMFQNQPAFNQNISTKTVTVGASTYTAWDTLNVINMRYAFYNNLANTASQFNQNIGNWNTIKVTDMTAMLFNTSSFNQNIGNWRVNIVFGFNSDTAIADTFADYNGLSQTNYDSLLIGWASRPVLPNEAISFGTTKYSSAAVAARAILTSAPNNWTIIDGGLI